MEGCESVILVSFRLSIFGEYYGRLPWKIEIVGILNQYTISLG